MSRNAFNIFKNYYNYAGIKVYRNDIQITGPFLRNISGQPGIATFKDVKEAKNNPKVIIIDVREPSELKETGVIPGSINIPFDKLVNAFKNMNQEQFEKIFERSKPPFDFPIIFTCKAGYRSQKAAEKIRELGYKKQVLLIAQVNSVEDAFKKLRDDEFQKLYGLPKPAVDSPIIFSCLLGKRSQSALETVKKLGFKNVRNFEGGWQEWEAKTTKKI